MTEEMMILRLGIHIKSIIDEHTYTARVWALPRVSFPIWKLLSRSVCFSLLPNFIQVLQHIVIKVSQAHSAGQSVSGPARCTGCMHSG